jgi:hypothetical protein
MRIMSCAAIGAMGLCMVACAQTPESVQPAYESEVPYLSFTCQQLGEERARLSAALATASSEQNQTRSGDIAGVLLLGLPVSSMSGGNIAPEIAHYKGEIEAVDRASIRKGCTAKAVS